MRIFRVLVAVLTTALLALPVSFLVSANASSAPLPQRHITDGLKKPHSGHPNFVIKVRDYSKGRVVLQKKRCETCKYKDQRTQRTNTRGKVIFTLDTPNSGAWYWRAYTPKTVNWAKTFTPHYIKTCRSVSGTC